MNNPQSRDPAKALWAETPNSTGWHVWKMLNSRTGASQTDYLRAFHRYNLGQEHFFHSENARDYWLEIEENLFSQFDTVVLLGAAVRKAAGLILPPLYVSRTLVALPHPSGLNRWYNNRVNREIVEVLLEELYTEAIAETC